MSLIVKVRPRCVAFVHPSMGSMSVCGKYADWSITNLPRHISYIKDFNVCRDCVAKTIINFGDSVDNIKFDIIIVDTKIPD